MEKNSLNPLSNSGTPIVPLVLTDYERYRYAVERRDAHARLVCDDLLAGRDTSWDLARYAALDAFIRSYVAGLR